MRYLKMIGGVLACITLMVLLVYLYATTLPQERSVSRTVIIQASPETLYDLAIDAGGQSAWRRDIAAITLKSGNNRWVEHTRQGDIHFNLTHHSRPHSFSLTFAGQGFSGTWRGTFTVAGTGTAVSLTETTQITNPLFHLLSKLMQFTEKFMDNYLHDLKTEAEKHHTTSSDNAANPSMTLPHLA